MDRKHSTEKNALSSNRTNLLVGLRAIHKEILRKTVYWAFTICSHKDVRHNKLFNHLTFVAAYMFSNAFEQ